MSYVGVLFGFLGMAGLAITPVDALSAPVVLISVDGLRPDAISRADAHGLRVPNLRRFLSEGAYAEGVIGVYPTSTVPSHATIVTGVDPAVHGIIDNTVFDPIHPGSEGYIWGRDIKAQTLWQAATVAGLKTASVHWPTTVDALGITYNIPQYAGAHAITHSDQRLMEAISRPDGYLSSLEEKVGPFVDHDYHEWDRVGERFAEQILRDQRPAFMTVHFVELDDVQHRVGVFRPEGAPVLESIDALIGQLMRTAFDVDPSTVIVVVSDHGFTDIHTEVNLVKVFADAGLIRLSAPDGTGKRHVIDWQVGVQAGETSALYLKNPQDQVVRNRVRAILAANAKVRGGPHS